MRDGRNGVSDQGDTSLDAFNPMEATMTTTVIDDPDNSQFEIFVDGRPAGLMQYYVHEQLAAYIHTEVAPEFEGQGLATELIQASLDQARARGWQVEPFCPFVRRFIGKHPEYRDLVPADEWRRFGLAPA